MRERDRDRDHFTMDVRCSSILSFWLSFHLLTGSECAGRTVHGHVGQNVVLPCRYDIGYHGELHSCWGRGEVPNSGCSNEVIASDGSEVTSSASKRYQLAGALEQGDVSLTIVGAEESDAGVYGCRVHIIGPFNDQKETVNLVITRAPEPTKNAPEWPTNVTEQASKTTWTPHAHTQGDESANSTESSDAAVPQNSEEPQPDGIQLAVLLPVVLLLLLSLIIVFLLFMRKRWKKASEMLGISEQPGTGVLYRNSESSLGLHSREMAVENIYQMDEGDDY
ncbi:hepatitis A virus cellular receptor 1 [Anguilla anguilla]|uniref:hepatitis A virus cellular receptor 1 n=1 Tax=Anguilla anguilla TaxID=7936 RepID=UPI0015A9D1C3|nr:hepatitis A virus cellular receptor 1 [Anguilla anguilla]